jgi:FixJ family two-component response regulator
MTKKRAWLLEEHDDTRELCVQLLEAFGFEVLAFRRSEDLLREPLDPPSVVVLDAWTASEHESDVADHIPLGRTLVTSTTLRSVELWNRIGAARVVLKPFASIELRDLVCELADDRVPRGC